MSKRGITVQQLRYLTAVGQKGSFRKAAEHCGISQPSLTVQIQAIEQQLQVRLVNRGAVGVCLTPLGQDTVDPAPPED